jgi:hypothetical protein
MALLITSPSVTCMNRFVTVIVITVTGSAATRFVGTGTDIMFDTIIHMLSSETPITTLVLRYTVDIRFTAATVPA